MAQPQSVIETSEDPFAQIQTRTRRHQLQHGCGAYTFEDGAALTELVAEHEPSRILELGTALGYTACCLAAGNSAASVETIEADAEHARLAAAEIERADLSHRIRVHNGTFENVLPKLSEGFDFAFFDGFAPSVSIIRLLHRQLARGGVLVCSNTQLAKRNALSQISDDFHDPSLWELAGSIESKRTFVLIKR